MSNSLSNLNFQDIQDIIDSCADLRSQLDRSDVETIIVNDFTKTFESNYTEGKEIYQNLKDGISEFYSSMNETADYTPYEYLDLSLRRIINGGTMTTEQKYKFLSELRHLTMSNSFSILEDDLKKDLNLDILKKSSELEFDAEQNIENPTERDVEDLLYETLDAMTSSLIFAKPVFTLDSIKDLSLQCDIDAFADSIRQNTMDEKDSLLLYSYAAYKKTRISSGKSKEDDYPHCIDAKITALEFAAGWEEFKVIEDFKNGKTTAEKAVDLLFGIASALLYCLALIINLIIMLNLAIAPFILLAPIFTFGPLISTIGFILLLLWGLSMAEDVGDYISDEVIVRFANVLRENIKIPAKKKMYKYADKLQWIVKNKGLCKLNKKWCSFIESLSDENQEFVYRSACDDPDTFEEVDDNEKEEIKKDDFCKA